MAVTYTPHIGLGMQQNKQDYLSWDDIVRNWQIIDREIGQLKNGSMSFSTPTGEAIPVAQGVPVEVNYIGDAQEGDIT